MTQSPNTKSTFPHLSWQGCELHFDNLPSCVLVDSDDTLDSIFSSDMAYRQICCTRGGIGINAGRIRGINSKIRGGEVQHTSVVPFLKKFDQLSDAARKTVSEVVQQLSTFLSGIKKSRISSS